MFMIALDVDTEGILVYHISGGEFPTLGFIIL
jgi:hypothetical protein